MSTTMATRDVDTLPINPIGTLRMDAVQKANSGHPGTPMGMVPVAYTLWQAMLTHYRKADPELADEVERTRRRDLSDPEFPDWVRPYRPLVRFPTNDGPVTLLLEQ